MKVSCPNCGQHYDVDQEYVGYNVECETCGTEFQVPQPGVSTDAHTMPEASISPAESASPQGEATLVSAQPSPAMKPLVCEMCGSSELVKRDGVFICQSCGTKYSVEEARKMMLTGTVNVTGTVKVDRTGKMENLTKLARREREAGKLAAAVEHYKQILLEDADNWEAYFYSEYWSVLNVDIVNQWPVVERFIEKFPTFVNMASTMSDSSERKFAHETISNEICGFMIFVRGRLDVIYQWPVVEKFIEKFPTLIDMASAMSESSEREFAYDKISNEICNFMLFVRGKIVGHYDSAFKQIYIFGSSQKKDAENRNRLLSYIARTCYALGDIMHKRYKAGDASASESMVTRIWKTGVEINSDCSGYENERQAAVAAIRYYEKSYNPPKKRRRAGGIKAWLLGIGLFLLWCVISGQSVNAFKAGEALGFLFGIYLLYCIVKWIIRIFRPRS